MPWGSWSYPEAPQPQPDQQAVPPGMLKAIQRMLGIEAPNDAAGPTPMTMAQPPVIGNRPDVQEAVKAAGASAAEPFGQLGRVMTGKSEEPLQDLATAAIGMVGPPGARAALKPLSSAAGTAFAKGTQAIAKEVETSALAGIPEARLGRGGVFELPLAGDKGRLEFAVDPGLVTMRGAHLDEAERGKGIASEGYRKIVDWALSSGRHVKSVGAPSEDAAKVYESLASRGYGVERVTDPAGRTEYTIKSAPAGNTGGLGDMIKAYHGSPHDFDRFDLGKIGSGEGAQSYGHGLYMAEAEDVAKEYEKALASKAPVQMEGDPGRARSFIENAVKEGRKAGESEPSRRAAAMSWLDDTIEMMRGKYAPAGGLETAQEAKQLIESGKVKPDFGRAGKMYQVGIRADPEHFLDWDKPLSEQSKHVQDVVGKVVTDAGRTPVAEQTVYDQAVKAARAQLGKDGLLGVVDPQFIASQKLREAGIPGIKYLDQGSRPVGKAAAAAEELKQVRDSIAIVEKQAASPTQAERHSRLKANEEMLAKQVERPTRNFVVFDDKLIDILKKYGIAGVGALPAMNAFHYQDKGS